MALQSIFVHNRYLGSREVPNFFRLPGIEPRPTHSYCYFCMRCGEIWARFLVPSSLHQIRCVPCEKHGDGRLACYRAWDWDPTHFDDSWPEAAMRYEFDVLMRRAEKEMQCEPCTS